MVAVAGDWGDRRPSHEMLIVAVVGDCGNQTRCLWLLLLETGGTGQGVYGCCCWRLWGLEPFPRDSPGSSLLSLKLSSSVSMSGPK